MYTHTYLYLHIDIRGPDTFQTFPDDLLGVYPSSRYTREVYIEQLFLIPFPEFKPLPDRIGLIVKNHPIPIELWSLGMDG